MKQQKVFYFNIQAKGGAGKSMLTYLQALKETDNNKSLFIDLDQSTETSKKQLKFLLNRNPPRFLDYHLLDDNEKIQRDKLLKALETWESYDYTKYYIDLGANESSQFIPFILKDVTAEGLLEDVAKEDLNDSKFVFNCVVSAGGGAYNSCMEYARKLAEALEGKFDFYIYINENKFKGNMELIEDIKNFAEENKGIITGVKYYGDFDTSSDIVQEIIDGIGKGYGLEDFKSIKKRKLRSEISKI